MERPELEKVDCNEDITDFVRAQSMYIGHLEFRLKLAEAVLEDIDFKTLDMDKELNTKCLMYLKGKT